MAMLIWNGSESDDTYTAPLDPFNEYDGSDLRGAGGDDRITGLADDSNFIWGGLGDDTLVGGTGANTLRGDEGDDLLDASRGTGALLEGGTGNDFLVGSSAAASTLDGGAGADTMVGGRGFNTYYVDSLLDVVVETYLPMSGDPPNPMDAVRSTVSWTLGANVESLFLVGDAAVDGTGNNLGNLISGNAAANVLLGGKGHDTLSGGGGGDSLAGGSGNDILAGDGGDDTLAGDSGNDVLRVDAAGDVVIELAGAGSDTVQASASYTLAESAFVEMLQLTGSSAIDATGNSLDNIIAGNTGNNVLTGGGGFDTLSFLLASSGVGVDLGTGQAIGQGVDTLAGFGRVIGSAFADTLVGSGAADVLDGSAGADLLVGNAGADRYVVDNAADVVNETGTVAGERDLVEASVNWSLLDNLENLQLTGGATVGVGNHLDNELLGNGAANSLSGGIGNDTLGGGSGNDTLAGGTGADLMTGGTGNDRYTVDHLGDTIIEASSSTQIDTVVASIDWTLGANLENLELVGLARGGTGNALANRLQGTSGNDTLDGGDGSDTLDGGDGSDVYYVGSATDVVTELLTATGTDEVRATVSYTLGSLQIERLVLLGTANLSGTGHGGNNRITGNTGNNSLSGLGGNDSLVGGDGNDTLRGGTGNDTLVGGNGIVTVQIDTTSGSDTVTGFVSGVDKLRVSTGAATKIGDGDTLVEGALTRAAAGGFSTGAELVVFSSNIAGSITTTLAAAKIGAATAAYTVGAARLFVVDNGTSTAVFRFVAADADAAVEAGELTLLATLTGTAATTTADYLFGG